MTLINCFNSNFSVKTKLRSNSQFIDIIKVLDRFLGKNNLKKHKKQSFAMNETFK